MKKYISISLLMAIMFVFISCSGSDVNNSLTLKKGTYSYSIMDSSKKSLVEGKMNIKTVTWDRTMAQYIVDGSYSIVKMTDDTSYTSFSTLKMSNGEFKGYYDDKRKFISINTNPKIADANIFINADVKGSEISGGWYYSSFRGLNKEAGVFIAKLDK